MTITDAIRNAESEHMVYSSTAYIETLQFSAKLPERLTRLPLVGIRDITTRFQQFLAERDDPSRRFDERAGMVIKEAVDILAMALKRLRWLMQRKSVRLTESMAAAGENRLRT